MASSKKGISALQLQRNLGLGSYKTAWFLAMRCREAMGIDPKADGPLGGPGETVEADATFIDGKESNKHSKKRIKGTVRGRIGKQVVHTLVERGGRARSHHVPDVTAKTLRSVMFKNIDRKSHLMTDTGGYHNIGRHFASHSKVDHSAGEYVRGDAHSNTAEAYLAILTRGIFGVFHSVSEAHLARYLNEFDFRWSNRTALGVDNPERAAKALKGAEGKRLMYSQSH